MATRYVIVFVLVVLVLLGSRMGPGNVGIFGAALVFSVTWGLGLSLLVRRQHGGLYRPAAAYLLVFGLFHGGLLVSMALTGGTSTDAVVGDDAFLFGSHGVDAVFLVIQGMATFTLVAAVAGGFRRERHPERERPNEQRAFGAVGLAAEAIGLSLFASTVVRAGGFGLLSGGYDAYLQTTQDDPLVGWAITLLGIGAVLAVVAGGTPRVLGWAGFLVYAAAAFPIGERGEVLFPLVVLLVVEARRGRRIPVRWTVIGAAVALALIGVVRQTRIYGFQSLLGSELLRTPLDAIAEMGYSIRPVVVVLGWHGGGELYADGATFTVVPVRFIEHLTGWHGGGPSAHDDRLFDVLINDRVGAIGGSPIAESYHNFGALGAVLFMGAIGLLLGLMERQAPSIPATAQLGVVMLPLLVQVRNSFAPVPAQVLVGVLLAAVPLLFLPRKVGLASRNPGRSEPGPSEGRR